MFGHNSIYNEKSFKDIPDETLKITSIFYSLQGEGPFSGQPAVFIRLTGCNLQCSFCDTYFDSGDLMTYDQIFNHIEKAVNRFYEQYMLEPSLYIRNELLLVITGGEPLLQPNLTKFLWKANEQYGYRTQIESNGTVFRELHPETHLVISPKINEKINKYVKPNKHLLERADTLKFVISTDMEGYKDVPAWALDWRNDYTYSRNRQIFVSPMNCYKTQPVKLGADGTLEGRSEIDERISFWTPNLLDLEKNQQNHEYAAFIAMKHGIRLSLQTHLFASLP